MSLEEYHRRRNFNKTNEPKGGEKLRKDDKLIYVIQKHDASHLHYDLRLEMSGVLKSWAIPKEPPFEPEVKRLAVQVEDHPLDYSKFEGTIPPRQYGAGKVETWDRGTYDVLAMEPRKIIVYIHGSKIRGAYCLIQLKQDSKNWLFFKKKRDS
ncbi:MAG: DNA polymerase ligase N-terminal domain-containing protein [Candidatus Bathyarchaeota archaeon]